MAVLINLFPVVGVVGFGWDLVLIVVLYWVEAIIYVVRSSFEALFAVRPVDDDHFGSHIPLERLSEKRGSVRVVDWLPPIHPRYVPFALNGGVLLFGLVTCAVLVAGYARPPITFGSDTLLTVGTGIVLVIGREAITLSESLRLKRYEAHSALSLFSRRQWMRVVILAFIVQLPIVGGTQSGIGFAVMFVLVVTAKLYYDVRDAHPSDDPERPEDIADQGIEIPTSDPITIGYTDMGARSSSTRSPSERLPHSPRSSSDFRSCS